MFFIGFIEVSKFSSKDLACGQFFAIVAKAHRKGNSNWKKNVQGFNGGRENLIFYLRLKEANGDKFTKKNVSLLS